MWFDCGFTHCKWNRMLCCFVPYPDRPNALMYTICNRYTSAKQNQYRFDGFLENTHTHQSIIHESISLYSVDSFFREMLGVFLLQWPMPSIVWMNGHCIKTTTLWFSRCTPATFCSISLLAPFAGVLCAALCKECASCASFFCVFVIRTKSIRLDS